MEPTVANLLHTGLGWGTRRRHALCVEPGLAL